LPSQKGSSAASRIPTADVKNLAKPLAATRDLSDGVLYWLADSKAQGQTLLAVGSASAKLGAENVEGGSGRHGHRHSAERAANGVNRKARLRKAAALLHDPTAATKGEAGEIALAEVLSNRLTNPLLAELR
jgi:hypothetical protein